MINWKIFLYVNFRTPKNVKAFYDKFDTASNGLFEVYKLADRFVEGYNNKIKEGHLQE